MTQSRLCERRCIRVEAKQDLFVFQWVLLLHHSPLRDSAASNRTQDSLDFGRIDELADIGLANHASREEEVLLERRWLGGAAVDLVERSERSRRPDDEATKMATRSEQEQVERVDAACLYTRNVPEGLHEVLAITLRVVDNERTAALTVPATTKFALACTQLARLCDLLHIGHRAEALEKCKR